MAEINGFQCSDFERDLYMLVDKHARRATPGAGLMCTWAHISSVLTFVSVHISRAYSFSTPSAKTLAILVNETAAALVGIPPLKDQALLDTLPLPKVEEQGSNVIVLPPPKPTPPAPPEETA